MGRTRLEALRRVDHLLARADTLVQAEPPEVMALPEGFEAGISPRLVEALPDIGDQTR